MKEITEKLSKYLNNRGLKQKDIAERLGVTEQCVNALINGRRAFGRKSSVEWQKQFGLSASWLMTGEGEMLASSMQTDTDGIPLIPIDAMAGVFTDNNSVGITPEMCEYYTVPSFKGADFLITVKGDSMTPRYFGGDIVACKKLSLTDIFFQWGKVYVLDTEQGVLIKKVQKSTDDAHITLVSENTDYAPFDIPMKAIYHIALVIGSIRME